jgi:hypothetical protein
MKTLFCFIFLLVGNLLFAQENKLLPLKPSLLVLVNGKPFSKNISISETDKLSIKIVPNPQNALVHYEISQIEVFKNSPNGLEKIGGTTLKGRDASQEIALPIMGFAFQKGIEHDLYFQIKDIEYQNANGEHIVDTRFTEAEKTLIVKVQK